jgi:hypothetical protein
MAAPRNIEYYISRIAGYSKNTIKLQPVSQKAPFYAGDVTIFRLPTNAIIDLHTLSLSFDLGIATTWGTNANPAGSATSLGLNPTFFQGPCRAPRYAEALLRRVDVTAGGVQVGLGSLTDYGSAFSFLAMNTIPKQKHFEMNALELGGGDKYVSNTYDNNVMYNLFPQNSISENTFVPTQGGNYTTAAYQPYSAPEGSGDANVLLSTFSPQFPSVTAKPADTTTTTYFQRVNATMWLGILGGQYMRFLDTNLLPDIEIRITWARNNVLLQTPGSASAAMNIYGPNMTMETIGFADNTYESMVEARLSTNDPIVVPFINWASYETTATCQNAAPPAINKLDGSATGGPLTPAAGAPTIVACDMINYTAPSGGTTVQQQFTIATQSLNALYGTLRAGDYDNISGVTAPLITYFAAEPTNSLYTSNGTGAYLLTSITGTSAGSYPSGQYQYNGTNVDPGLVPAKRLFNQMYTSYYYRFCGFDSIQPQTGGGLVGDPFDHMILDPSDVQYDGPPTNQSNTIGAARYQFTVDSKVYPQFQADVSECYTLTRNSFDGSGGNRDFVSLFGSLKTWYGNAFSLGVSFEHNSEDAMRDRLVSGLNTNGSNIPITFTANGVSLPPILINEVGATVANSPGWATNTVRPIVFCNMTSTLLIYSGRIISVIN